MKQIKNRNWIALPYILVLLTAVLRLMLDHHYNLIPVFSCILFFGANRPRREFPIALLALTGVDIFLTTNRFGYALTIDQAVIWACYLAAMMLGEGVLRGEASMARVAGTILLACLSFFIVSNFVVWAAWEMYPKTFGGMGACYIAALPFFRNSVVSETVFSMLFFTVSRYSDAFMQAARMQRACS